MRARAVLVASVLCVCVCACAGAASLVRFAPSLAPLHAAPSASASAAPPSYTTTWVTQYVDHFDPTDPTLYKERVLYSTAFYQRGGPMIFYTGNEGSVDSYWANTGYLFELAARFHALLVFAEHRYYGQSMPFGADSLSNANIRFLTTEQAMADFAVVIDMFASEYATGRVMTVGGSYGGMLAVYMRLRYPTLVDVAWGASAPVIGIGDACPPEAFFATVTDDFLQTEQGAECGRRVRAGFAAVQSLLGAGRGIDVAQALHLCDVPSASDFALVAYLVRNAFVNMAMLDYPYPTDFGAVLPGNPVNATCDAIVAQPVSDADPASYVRALRIAVDVFVNSTGTVGCYNYTADPPCADPTGCGGARAWDFQSCTEYVFEAGTNGVDDFFPVAPFDHEWLENYCKATFGDGVRLEPEWTRMQWSSAAWMTKATKVVFSNGRRDPWSSMGITAQPASQDVLVVMIDNSAHHLDLRGSTPLDPPSVTKARVVISNQLAKWLLA